MKCKIITGDWSNDGHGKTRTIEVEITSDHTVEQLQANYKKNCDRWGYTLGNVVERYEDSRIPEGLIRKMQADSAPSAQEWDPDGFDGWVGLDYDNQAHFVMDFMAVGMNPPLEWQESASDAVLLIGGHSAEIENSFGYGLFS